MMDFWKIIIPLLVGAALTLATQWILNWAKNRKEKIDKVRDLISKGRASSYLIAQLVKDLAMYKAHKQYYLQAYKAGIDMEDSYKKHYEKGQEQRAVENKLDEKIAEYFQIISEYHILRNKKEDFKREYESIFQFQHPKPSKFSKTSEDELVQELYAEEKRLVQIYESSLLLKFHALQNSMT